MAKIILGSFLPQESMMRLSFFIAGWEAMRSGRYILSQTNHRPPQKTPSIPQSHLSVPCLQSQFHLENFDDSEFSHLAIVKNENHHLTFHPVSCPTCQGTLCLPRWDSEAAVQSLFPPVVRHSGSSTRSSPTLRPTLSRQFTMSP